MYNKGLYRQSLKVLDRTKQKAIEEEQNVLRLEIIDFEKMIESQYITRSMETRAEELTGESRAVSDVVTKAQELSNLGLSLYGLYLKVGHVKSEHDYQLVKNYFDSNLPNYRMEELTFFEKLYLFQSKVWYYYIIQDFPNCYRNAQYWVDLFQQQPDMISKQMDLYIKGLHNLQLALFNTWSYSKYVRVIEQIEDLRSSNEFAFTENNRVLLFLFSYLGKIDKPFPGGLLF